MGPFYFQYPSRSFLSFIPKFLFFSILSVPPPSIISHHTTTANTTTPPPPSAPLNFFFFSSPSSPLSFSLPPHHHTTTANTTTRPASPVAGLLLQLLTSHEVDKFYHQFSSLEQPLSSFGAASPLIWLLAMEKGNGCCFSMMASNVTIILVILTITFIAIRVLYVIYETGKPLCTTARQPVSTLIVLGSGGHTAEMLYLLSVLQKDRFTPRFYIAAATDNMSIQKACSFENSLVDKAQVGVLETAQFMQIYRSREVGQSYLTSVGTTLIAMAHALWLIIKIRPQVVLGIRWSSIFYVESIARVRKLSLSGLLLYKLRMADQLFVQWPQLQRKYPRAHYVGRLM